MLPARVVLDYNKEDGRYRTWLEVLPKEGEPQYFYGRFFDIEEDALRDFDLRVQRL